MITNKYLCDIDDGDSEDHDQRRESGGLRQEHPDRRSQSTAPSSAPPRLSRRACTCSRWARSGKCPLDSDHQALIRKITERGNCAQRAAVHVLLPLQAVVDDAADGNVWSGRAAEEEPTPSCCRCWRGSSGPRCRATTATRSRFASRAVSLFVIITFRITNLVEEERLRLRLPPCLGGIILTEKIYQTEEKQIIIKEKTIFALQIISHLRVFTI